MSVFALVQDREDKTMQLLPSRVSRCSLRTSVVPGGVSGSFRTSVVPEGVSVSFRTSVVPEGVSGKWA